RPDLETDEGVVPESVGDRYVGCVAAPADEHAADPGDVVARIEGVTAPPETGPDPAGEVQRAIRRRHADIAEIAGAIARRNVHAAAKSDGEMGIVATDSLAFVEGVTCGHCRADM